MVSISQETLSQTDARLRYVIAASRLMIYDKPYHFEEFALAEFASRASAQALALVRDDAVWSQLVASTDPRHEQFAIWRFHFPDRLDNSGFVGWLASHLKVTFGTGVFVVCGQNSSDGGIFDYWGCPWTLREDVVAAVQSLVSSVSLT